MTPVIRSFSITSVSLISGIALWYWSASGIPVSWTDAVVPIFFVVVCSSARGRDLLNRLRKIPRESDWRIATGISIAAIVYLLLVVFIQGRPLIPLWHDEYMFLLQAQMLARLRLWMPAHPLGDFFDTFYVFTRPVYASQSFPGASLMYAPAALLGWAFWITPILLAGLSVGTLYVLMTRLIHPLAGILAATILLSSSVFRCMSIKPMAAVPAMLLLMWMVLAWLKWRDGRKWRYVYLMGVCAGWCAITRPADALAVALPVGLGLILPLRREPVKVMRALALLLVGALPFLVLLGVFNLGVTGHLGKTPFSYYNEIYEPQIGFKPQVFNPDLRPASTVTQKQLFYYAWLWPYVKVHQPARFVGEWIHQRLPILILYAVGSGLLVVLMPLGLLGLTTGPRRAMAGGFFLFLLVYLYYTIFLNTYAVVIIPIGCMFVGLGVQQLERRLAHVPQLVDLPWALAMGLSVASFAIVRPGVQDDPLQIEARQVQLAAHLREQIPTRAVVQFRFHPDDMAHESVHDEPVFNADVAWPDDADIIRAHDLGPERNAEVVNYYAARQPDRSIYLFDRADDSLVLIGNVLDLKRQVEALQKSGKPQ